MSNSPKNFLFLSLATAGAFLTVSGCASRQSQHISPKTIYQPSSGYSSFSAGQAYQEDIPEKKSLVAAEQEVPDPATHISRPEVSQVSYLENVATEQPQDSQPQQVAPLLPKIVETRPENKPGSSVKELSVDRDSPVMNIEGDSVPFTVENAIQLAMTASPAVSELHAKIDALVGKRTQAGLRPNPTVGINGEDINEDGGAGRYGVYYSQRVVRGGKLELSQRVVDSEIQVANQQLETVRQRLETDTKKLFYELLIATEKERLASQLVSISSNAANVSKKLFEAKESSKTVLLQSEIELQETKVLLNQAKNQKAAAQRRLGALVKTDLSNRNVTGKVKKGWEVASQDEAYQTILNQNPLIQSLVDDIQRANQVVCRQRVQPIGDMTWQTNLQFDTVGDDVIAGFQVGLPIARNNYNQGAIHQAKQMVVAAGQRLEKQKMKLKIDLLQAYQNYRDAEIQIRAYQDRILPLAKESLDLINEGYRQGESNFLQLLTAQRTYFQTNLAYLDQLRNMWQRKIEIDGMLLSGSLQE